MLSSYCIESYKPPQKKKKKKKKKEKKKTALWLHVYPKDQKNNFKVKNPLSQWV